MSVPWCCSEYVQVEDMCLYYDADVSKVEERSGSGRRPTLLRCHTKGLICTAGQCIETSRTLSDG